MDGDTPGPWWKRLGWLIAIWAMSIAVLAVVASIIRFWLKV